MGYNSNVWKDKARISMFAVVGLDKNSNVCKKTARILMFERIGSKLQCPKKQKARIPRCGWIR